MRSAFRLLPALAVLSSAVPAAARCADPERTWISGGLVDLGADVGYLKAPGGGVDAVDLGTGRTRFHIGGVDQTLFVIDGAILTAEQDDAGLRVYAHDGRGRRLFRSDRIEFPAWAVKRDKSPIFASSIQRYWHRDRDDLVLVIEARRGYTGGPPPTGEIEAQEKYERRVARIDRRTGRVTVLPPDAPLGMPPAKPWPSLVHTCGGETGYEAWVAGDREVTLDFDEATGMLRLARRERGSGRELPALPLLGGSWLKREHLDRYFRFAVSADGRLVTVTVPDLPAALLREEVRGERVFSTETGQPASPIPPAIRNLGGVALGARFYQSVHVQGPGWTEERLRVLDLATQRVLWERQVGPRRVEEPMQPPMQSPGAPPPG